MPWTPPCSRPCVVTAHAGGRFIVAFVQPGFSSPWATGSRGFRENLTRARQVLAAFVASVLALCLMGTAG